MKTQQRTFVVEFKSARRRSSLKQDSIWGTADLKALAREAEADAPHLFEPNAGSTALGEDGVLPSESGPATHLDDKFETVDDKQISASLAEAEQFNPPQQDNGLTFSSVSDVKEGCPKRGSPGAPRHRRQTSVIHHTRNATSADTVRPITAQGEMHFDALVTLEDENRRLKGLLANHLRQQNRQLRAMLARFGGL